MLVRRETRVGRAEGPWRATAPPATSSGRCRTRCWPANYTPAASWAISTWPRCPEPQPDALWAAWLTLDDPQRHAMDATFQDITALSGLAALVVKVRVLRTGRDPLARCARRSGYGRTAR